MLSFYLLSRSFYCFELSNSSWKLSFISLFPSEGCGRYLVDWELRSLHVFHAVQLLVIFAKCIHKFVPFHGCSYILRILLDNKVFIIQQTAVGFKSSPSHSLNLSLINFLRRVLSFSQKCCNYWTSKSFKYGFISVKLKELFSLSCNLPSLRVSLWSSSTFR